MKFRRLSGFFVIAGFIIHCAMPVVMRGQATGLSIGLTDRVSCMCIYNTLHWISGSGIGVSWLEFDWDDSNGEHIARRNYIPGMKFEGLPTVAIWPMDRLAQGA
jgi:hypothetical protein